MLTPRKDRVKGLSELIKEAIATAQEKLKGGRGDGKPDSDFDPNDLQEGLRHEMEHTTDPDVAKEIAKDHLTEDPDYYKRLKQMEKGNG